MSDPDTPARETCPATTMTASDIILVDDESSTSGEKERLDHFLDDMGSYLEDRVQVVSFPGLSQYSMGGPSACGLIAMNCVRMVLSMECEGKTGRSLFTDMLKKETVVVSLELYWHSRYPSLSLPFAQKILSICEFWANAEHLAPEDIIKTPIFQTSLQSDRCTFGKSNQKRFGDIIRYECYSRRFNSGTLIHNVHACL